MATIIEFPNDYCVLDVETTGYSAEYDDIIEFGMIRVRGGEMTETYQQLVNPGYALDEFIVEKTGITDADLVGAPSVGDVIAEVLDFIGNDIVLGHNVPFDARFLDAAYSEIGKSFENETIDTMRISRKLAPNLEHHRLCDLDERFDGGASRYHRALADCETTRRVFENQKNEILERFGSFDEFKKLFIHGYGKHYSHPSLDLRQIIAEPGHIDEDNPLFGKVCVFTGALEKFTRKEAAQLVVNIGGICGNGVTTKTNFLILGSTDYCASLKGAKSSKHKKAEQLIAAGQDLIILPEDAFYNMILDY